MLNKIKDNLGGNLKCAFTGGAKLEFEVQQFFGDIGIPIIEGYGLTETSPIIVTEKYGPTEFTQGGLQEAPGVQVRSIFVFLVLPNISFKNVSDHRYTSASRTPPKCCLSRRKVRYVLWVRMS